MRIITTLFAFFFSIVMHAQPLTEAEALIFSEKLLDAKIINVKGKHHLDSFILAGNFIRPKKVIVAPHEVAYRKGLSRSQILIWLGKAFYFDMLFRSGYIELQQDFEERFKAAATMEARAKVRTEMDSVLSAPLISYAGPKIETEIPDEDFQKPQFVDFPPGLSRIEFYDLVHPTRSVLGKTVRRTLKDLYQIGLIDEKIYERINKEIVPESAWSEFAVIASAFESAIFYEDFAENKKIEQAYIQKFRRNGLLTEEALDRLNDTAFQDKILNPYDIFRACSNSLVINTNTLSGKPEQIIKKVYNALEGFIPNFDFKKFKVVKNYTADGNFKTYQISFEANGKVYKTALTDYSVSDTIGTISLMNYELYEPVNQFLRHQDDSVRLFVTKTAPESEFTDDKYMLLLLTKGQKESGMEIFLSGPEYFKKKFEINIDSTIALYEKIGLLNHLSKSDWKKAKANLRRTPINSYQDLLRCFSNIVVAVDWKIGIVPNPYESYMLRFAACSQGFFEPEKIVDEYSVSKKQETGRFSFDFKGKHYEMFINSSSDMLQPEFLDLIKNALAENNIEGKFYHFIDDKHGSGFIFLTHKQFEILKQAQPTLILRG